MKTLKLLSMILSLFFILGSTVIFAESDGAPVKHGNRLVCSNCTSPEEANINKAAYNESMILKTPVADFTRLMPLVPKEASFEEETESMDSLMLKSLKPAAPAEATFNEDDPVMTYIIKRLTPVTPSKAGFEDLR